MPTEKFTSSRPATLIETVIRRYVQQNGQLPTLEQLREINPYREIGTIRQRDVDIAIARATPDLKQYIDAV